MAVSISVDARDIDRLRASVRRAPGLVKEYVAKAVLASAIAVEKQAVDRNFQFKWPRAARTGVLQRSWDFGRFIHPSGLMASVGPTAHYAPYVYFGTSRGLPPNPFMDRIAAAASPEVARLFGEAADAVALRVARM